jgi:DNA-binding HxlR family transcriptional regulator
MRSYGQYCAVAKALDVIGDRWNLLIVRELLSRGPCRYTDLQAGLPGIATNLLADRIRDLEQAGVVRRDDAPPPIATTLFRLTPRGEALKPVLVELGRWGIPFMAEPADELAFRAHWLSILADLYPVDLEPDGPPVTIELRGGDQSMVMETVDGAVQTRRGSAANADLILTGTPQLILGVVSGRLDLAEASARGLRYEGDPKTLCRFRPESPTSDLTETTAGRS